MKNEKLSIKNYLPYACVLLMAVVLTVFESNLLYQLQDQNLFLHTTLFFKQRMVVPGGLLEWAGTYLTQFFFYPWLGAGLLCLLWIMLLWMLQRAFGAWKIWSLVPIACLLLTIANLGYWVYYLKLPGHAFDATLGTLIAVCLTWGYKVVVHKRWISTLLVVLTVALGYPLFGFYALWAALLMVATAWREKGQRIVDSLAALLCLIAVPLLCYHLLFHETNIINIYWAALPMYQFREETYAIYYLPYILLLASILFMSCCKPVDLKKWGEGIIAIIVLAGTVLLWEKDGNFHRELSMVRSIDHLQWEQVLKTTREMKEEPTRAICMMQNLALFRQGRQGDEMFNYPNGARQPAAPFPLRMVHTQGKMLYLQMGVPNYCYRWCMEDGVEFGWSVHILKLMAKCSLLNNEPVAAQRFVNMLKRTDFHKAWAKKYENYIHQPQLIAKDPELGFIRHLMRQDNFLTADMSQMEMFLLEHFTTAQSEDPLLQEQILIASMMTKNMPLFWQEIVKYTNLHKDARMPRHYQEATCLFGHLQNIDVGHIPFDPLVVKNYQDFAGTVGEMQRQGKSIDEIRPLVHDRFRNTYYYDFYFNRYNYVEP